jgi:hypothetical protein
VSSNILTAALEDFLGKDKERKNDNVLITVLGIPRGGGLVPDVVATKLSSADFDILFVHIVDFVVLLLLLLHYLLLLIFRIMLLITMFTKMWHFI